MLENDPRWLRAFRSATVLTEGPTGAGTAVRYNAQFFGSPVEITEQVEEYTPGRLLALQSAAGPVNHRHRREVEPWDGGTRVTCQSTYQSSDLLRMAAPWFERVMAYGLETGLERLRELLESPPLAEVSLACPDR